MLTFRIYPDLELDWGPTFVIEGDTQNMVVLRRSFSLWTRRYDDPDYPDSAAIRVFAREVIALVAWASRRENELVEVMMDHNAGRVAV